MSQVVLNFITYDGTSATLPAKGDMMQLLFVREIASWDREYPHFGIIASVYWTRPRKGDMWAYWDGPRSAPCLIGKNLYAWRDRKKLIPREVAEMSGGVLTEERIRAIERSDRYGDKVTPTKEEHAAIVALIWPGEQIAESEGKS